MDFLFPLMISHVQFCMIVKQDLAAIWVPAM